jgi:hypothetical protein
MPSRQSARSRCRPSNTSLTGPPSAHRASLGLNPTSRDQAALTTSRTTAPSKPPTRLLSGPMIAFCTTFDNSGTVPSPTPMTVDGHAELKVLNPEP